MNRAPRAIYIVFEAFPRPKGASAHIASMVQALSRDLSPVLLLCLGYGDMPTFQEEGNLLIHRFKAYHPNMLRRALEFGAFVTEALARHAKGSELIVFRDPWGGLPAVGQELGVPLLFEVNALPSWELGYTYPGFRGNVTLRAKLQDLERRCLRAADRILTVSQITSRALRRLEPRCAPISVVPNAAHPAFAMHPPETVKENKCEIGYFGSLHPWQGVEVAVDALALIADGFPDISMPIITAGRKATRKRIRKRIRKLGLVDRVRLVPPMPPVKLADTVRRCTFTVAPLLETHRNVVQGCCPIKIVESMAAGVPVIASDLEVTRILIRHGDNGWLVPPGSPRALARAMAILLEDRERLTRIGLRARKTAMERFGREVVHGQLQEVFKKTCTAGATM